jgi:hypothetical protein
LASASAYLFISVHFDFHTGDLNPFWTAPMLGTHKSRHATPISRPVFMPFPTFNLNPVIDTRPR